MENQILKTMNKPIIINTNTEMEQKDPGMATALIAFITFAILIASVATKHTEKHHTEKMHKEEVVSLSSKQLRDSSKTHNYAIIINDSVYWTDWPHIDITSFGRDSAGVSKAIIIDLNSNLQSIKVLNRYD